MSRTWTYGLASVPKGIEDNATTKGTIDVHGRTFDALDPGGVLWDTGAQEGIVGKQQLNQWCKLLAEYGLQVEWSQEKPEFASGIGGATQPIGVVHVPVGLAGYNGIIRFTVVEQDVPPLLPVGIMRKLKTG